MTDAALRAVATPLRRPSAAVTAGIVLAVGAATVGAVVLGGGRPAIAAAPTLLATGLFAVWKVPLRWSTSVLVVLLLSLDGADDAQGEWRSPLAFLGDLLRNNLDKIGFPRLLGLGKLNGMELALLVLLAVALARKATRSHVDGPAQAPHPGVVGGFSLLYLASLALSAVNGLGHGGNVDFAIVQLRPLLHLPLVVYLAQAAYRGPRDHALLGRAVVLSACLKAGLAVWVDRTVAPLVRARGDKWACATNHGDSVLFSIAAAILLLHLIQRPTRRRLLHCAVLLPVIALGMIHNHRRLAWVDLAAVALVVYFVDWGARWKRSLTRIAIVTAPLVLLYVGAGWGREGRLFAPVRILHTVLDAQVDRSTLYRDVENWNLVMSIAEAPLLGRGFGHGFSEFLKGDDISSIFALYAIEPHNGVLGLVLFEGGLAFATTWILFAVGIFLAVRAARAASSPDDRAAALSCLAAIVVVLLQIYGDLGQYFIQWQLAGGLALATVGKLAVTTGAWPQRRRASVPAPGLPVPAGPRP